MTSPAFDSREACLAADATDPLAAYRDRISIPEGIIYGVPVTTANGEYTRITDLPVDEFSRKAMDKTLAELEEERAGVAHLL